MTRAITVRAPVEQTWGWLCQVAVAPCSYDWIDDRGRRSPRTLTPGADELRIGQTMAVVFELVEAGAPHHWTAVTGRRGQRMFGPVAMTYAAEPHPAGSARPGARLAGMQTYRTPEDRFAGLPDFAWEPRYAEVPDPDGGTLRMAYVEAGPADGPVVLLLHGEPTWSFLYRHVIGVLADAGIRAVAPDMVGFGRSDKPLDAADHSYARHVEWLRALVLDHLDLREVALVGQDWGGLLGLRLVAEHPDRFARVVAANTGLPTGDHDMPEVWWAFRRAVEGAEVLDIGRLVAAGCVRGLDDDARAAYDAPFPDEAAKAGPRAMPGLVPTRPDDPASEANRAAWAVLGTWEKPFLTAFGDSDPITGAMGPLLRKLVPGAGGRPHPTLERAGHFLQEDAGEELGRVVADFVTAP